ncbi:MAG: hypothetical protein ABI743_10205 [bacterium]
MSGGRLILQDINIKTVAKNYDEPGHLFDFRWNCLTEKAGFDPVSRPGGSGNVWPRATSSPNSILWEDVGLGALSESTLDLEFLFKQRDSPGLPPAPYATLGKAKFKIKNQGDGHGKPIFTDHLDWLGNARNRSDSVLFDVNRPGVYFDPRSQEQFILQWGKGELNISWAIRVTYVLQKKNAQEAQDPRAPWHYPEDANGQRIVWNPAEP